jgi:hypothetical protein
MFILKTITYFVGLVTLSALNGLMWAYILDGVIPFGLMVGIAFVTGVFMGSAGFVFYMEYLLPKWEDSTL